MCFLGDDEEKLRGSPGTMHTPGMIPAGFDWRSCQQRSMISLHEQIRIPGGGNTNEVPVSGVEGLRPRSPAREADPLSNSPPARSSVRGES